MSDYFQHPSGYGEAASLMSGAGQGVAGAFLQAPALAMHARQLQALMQEQAQHGELYQAQADLARAHTGAVQSKQKIDEGDHAALVETGTALADIAAGGGQASAEQFRRAFIGMATKNPGALANFFVHLAPYVGAHTPDNPNQPMDMAMILGRKDFGADANVPANTIRVGPDGQPKAYGISTLGPGSEMRLPVQPSQAETTGAPPYPDIATAANLHQPQGQRGTVWAQAMKDMMDPMLKTAPQSYQDLVHNIVGSIPTNAVPTAGAPIQAPPLNGPQPLVIPRPANAGTNPAPALRVRKNPATGVYEYY